MSLNKKILILKQTEKGFSLANKSISAILKLEYDSGVTTLFLSIVNIAAVIKGKYFLYFYDAQKNLYTFDLNYKPTSFSEIFIKNPDLSYFCYAGIVYIENDLPSLCAFGTDCENENSLIEFKKIIADNCLTMHKKNIIEDEQNNKLSADKTLENDKINSYNNENFEKINNKPQLSNENLYNDEAVATENYYEIDEKINEKLKILSEKENELLRSENVNANNCNKEEAQETYKNLNELQDEAPSCGSEKYSDNRPYYFTAKKELDKLFEKFPEEKMLSGLFPKSKWVKISYSDTKYYVVGLIYENDAVRYICYGVPSYYSENEPEELKGYCSFIPLSIFDMKGKGYWMMFQDAITGECVKKYRA